MLRYMFYRAANKRRGRLLTITTSSLSLQRTISSSLQLTSLSETIDSLKALATELGSKSSEWTTNEEQQAKAVLSRCRELVADVRKPTCSADVRSICLIADQLGSRIVQKNKTSFSPDLFVDYLDFYAVLGRPDITQSAFGRIASQWRRPSVLSYAAQQRALLRFHANSSSLLQKTMGENQDNVKVVTDRLEYRTVAQIIDGALEKDRRTRRFVKVLEYGSYTALAALVAKWVWIGNSVFMAGVPLLPKALASVAALLAAAAGVRLALRHSIMGSLTAPLLSDLSNRSLSSAASQQLSFENDSDAFRKLRQAFPASPSDETMAEINEMIFAANSPSGIAYGRLQLSWKLQLALMWSRFARRFAVVEPALISQHELCQYLAVSWLREIVHMFVPQTHSTTEYTRRVSSKAVSELLQFVNLRFSSIPLMLGHSDIAAISRFVIAETDASTVNMFLDLVACGYLALSRDQQNAGKRHHAPVISSVTDFHKQQAGAAILAYCCCIQSAVRVGPGASGQLYTALQKLAGSDTMPISRSLCQVAFQGARALESFDKRQVVMEELVRSLEVRYEQKDPYFMHLLEDSRQTISDSPPTASIVRCINDYIAALVRDADVNGICSFVKRWLRMGILTPVAAEQCLLAAANMALPSLDKPRSPAKSSWKSAQLEQVAELACTIAANSANNSLADRIGLDNIALPMYTLLTRILCEYLHNVDSHDTLKSADSVLFALSTATSHSPILRNYAPLDFNESAIKLLLALASRQHESESNARLVSSAIGYLDLMRRLDQVPAQKTIEQLCTAAARLNMDISAISKYWAGILKGDVKNQKISSFAKSLL
ncbi:hypothetical protein IWW45_007806 [Coemansia sp. RSA 485]|nr:hypothetical protein IWW45_007806 [Coemansia sp. RSA 485]